MRASLFVVVIASLFFSLSVKSQSTNDLLNVLVLKKLLLQKEADSLRADAAFAAQADLAKIKSFPVGAGRKMSISGYTQIRYQVMEEAGKIDGFDIRRARVDVKGNLTPYWSYRLQFDLAGTPKLIDAYAEFKLNSYLNFTIGQAKVPFSLENLTSSGKLELIDRSQVVEALVARGKDVVGNQNGRDIGIQVGGTLFQWEYRPLVDYQLGFFNGSGINATDKNRNKDLAARLIVHPVTGLGVAGAFYNGSVYKSENEKSVTRNRYGFDFRYDWRDLALRGEFIHGKDGSTEREGYYLQAGYYFLEKKFQLLAKYDFYDADKSVSRDAATWYVFGANYNFNANIRLQANYTVRQEEAPSLDNNYASIQLQLGF